VNASQLNITFQPNDLVVQVGVNNTIYFVNTDLKFNFGFDIESIAWPTGGQTFAFTILPGRICNVTLTTPGVYRYDCEMHPIWTIGTITVVPAVS
jgi:plastocyanin